MLLGLLLMLLFYNYDLLEGSMEMTLLRRW